MKFYEYCENCFKKCIKHKKLLAALVVAVLLVFIAIHYVKLHKKEKHSALPVSAEVAKLGDFNFYISALGSVNSDYTINITSQVNGQIKKLNFKDGQNVKAGELLVEIDPAFYEAQLHQNEGQLARDIALLDNARLDLKRYEELWKDNSISKQILDTQKALVAQYVGIVELDKGLVESAKVDLAYCKIRAPVTGRISISLIDEGNIVQSASSNSIAVVNTITPISVIFPISERDLPKILKRASKLQELLVEAYNHDKTDLLAVGNVIALDNQIDPLTGTVKIKASFPNEDMQLFPNQFVNIKLYVETLQNVLIVPTSAVQHSDRGTFVYLVNDKNRINVRKVAAGLAAEGRSIIESGINAGDLIVTEGVDKLTEGTLVARLGEANKDNTDIKKAK